MKCPACQFDSLTPITVGGVEVDVCQGGCGGIWFDHLEFKKLDEPHEHLGEALTKVQVNPKVVVSHDDPRSCPKCANVTMFRQFFSPKRKIEIDHCRVCGGHWLDLGELHGARSQFKTEAEKKAFAMAAYDQVFEEPLLKMKAESEEKRAAAREVARMLRFICPSYYIPGKQKWGAW